MKIRTIINLTMSLLLILLLFPGGAGAVHPEDPHQWSQGELETMKGLWLASLPPLPPAPSNAYADDPAAVALGRKFFFDSRFSGNEKVSCGTCHRPDYVFSDALPLAHGMGTTARRTMPILGLGYQYHVWGTADEWNPTGNLTPKIMHRSLCR